MIELFGTEMSREKLAESVGDMSQICGIESFEYNDGSARGVRALQLKNPGGLQLVVLPDRGMDIVSLEFKGVPLCWRSGAGIVSPYFYSAHEWEWLRSFAGGMLATCGLSNVGDPCVDKGAYLERERFGGHGRIANTPARDLAYGAGWEGERYVLHAAGTMIEAAGQGENFSMTRTLRAEMGRASFQLRDEVTNRSFSTVPYMFLYHINIGWPLLEAGAEICADIRAAEGLDRASREAVQSLTVAGEPADGTPELVYRTELAADPDGLCHVAFVNRRLLGGLGLYLEFRKEELPFFTIWKRMSKGEYVIGFEPGNCTVQGRVAERERGTLRSLAPQQSVTYGLEMGILSGAAEIDRYLSAHMPAGCAG
jgi:hypothetical protein